MPAIATESVVYRMCSTDKIWADSVKKMTFQTTSEAMTTMMETFVDFFVQAEDFTRRISHSPGQCCDCYTAIGPTPIQCLSMGR